MWGPKDKAPDAPLPASSCLHESRCAYNNHYIIVLSHVPSWLETLNRGKKKCSILVLIRW